MIDSERNLFLPHVTSFEKVASTSYEMDASSISLEQLGGNNAGA
jgi:hypothetical protein